MRKFKTESQKILDIMINSIYTNKEIFLRELISNCSDAIDKLYFKSLTENISGLTRDDFYIRVDVDKDARTITVSDNGIGFDVNTLEQNDGTHIGLKNVQERIEKMCGGSVTVVSQPDMGTTVTVYVPEREEEKA